MGLDKHIIEQKEHVERWRNLVISKRKKEIDDICEIDNKYFLICKLDECIGSLSNDYALCFIKNIFVLVIKPETFFKPFDYLLPLLKNSYLGDKNVSTKKMNNFDTIRKSIDLNELKNDLMTKSLRDIDILQVNYLYSNRTKDFCIATKVPYITNYLNPEIFYKSFYEAEKVIKNNNCLSHLRYDLGSLFYYNSHYYTNYVRNIINGSDNLIKQINKTIKNGTSQ